MGPDPGAMKIEQPFDPKTESIFCGRCGRQCEELGHMFSTFLLCPVHGEFTIAPVVIKRQETLMDLVDNKVSTIPNPEPGPEWTIVFRSYIEESMWENCRAIDKLEIEQP